MARTPFKMKGSPMKRNFGISPVKDSRQKKDKDGKWVNDPHKHGTYKGKPTAEFPAGPGSPSGSRSY